MTIAARYPSLTNRADFYDLEKAAQQGLLLPTASALALEDALIHNDSDLVTRARLLGYYSKRGLRGQKDQRAAARLKHILWLIENVPDCKFAGDIYLEIDKNAHPEHYARVKKSWSQAIGQKPACSPVKVNAAIFSIQHDPNFSVRLLRSVLQDSPTNLWAMRLMAYLGHGSTSSFTKNAEMPDGFDLEKWRTYADRMYLDTVVSHGERMPPESAETLETVLVRYPEDITARAELMGYYYRRWKRANVLQVDPDCLDRLTRHMLWCIDCIPGSKFVENWHGFASIDKKVAPPEHALLLHAWSEKVKDFPGNAAILASAASFFAECGYQKKVDKLVEMVKKHAKNDENAAFILEYGVGNARRRSSMEAAPKGTESALESVSIDTGASEMQTTFSSYNLAEWACEVDLNGAHLEGVYHWVPPSSIANLEMVLVLDSADIYNRAKIIGSYDEYYAEFSKVSVEEVGLTESQKSSYVRHMSWFVENIPESKFVATFQLPPLKKLDPNAYREVRDLLLSQADANKNNIAVLVNVAAALSHVDQTQARRLAKMILKLAPRWGWRILMLLGEKLPDPDVKAVLKQHAFRSGARNPPLSKIARLLDLQSCSLFGGSLPCRTIWSNERALDRNPNDLVLRAELLDAYDTFDQFSVNFTGHTPDVVPQLIKHNLWFIHHIPDHYLYSLGCAVNVHGWRERDRYLGDHAIILEAAKRQMRAYPTNLSIGLALHHYYPLGSERAAITALRKLEKSYPGNKQLKQRFDHLRGLLDVRSFSRKQRAQCKKD